MRRIPTRTTMARPTSLSACGDGRTQPPPGAPGDGRPLPWRDSEAFGALLRALEPRMHAVAVRFTRNPDAARDVVQNAFEKTLRHGSGFRGGSRVSTWVHRIVVNEALMWLRSQRRHARAVALDETLEATVSDTAPSGPERLAERQALERLRGAVEGLPRAERDVIRRCALEGWTYEQYGRERGIHPAAAKSRAFRARRRLGRALDVG